MAPAPSSKLRDNTRNNNETNQTIRDISTVQVVVMRPHFMRPTTSSQDARISDDSACLEDNRRYQQTRNSI